MHRYFIAVRLIFFIGVATVLYMNASSAITSNKANGEDIKNTLSIELEDSHKIWSAVNYLEDTLYGKKEVKKNAINDIRITTAKRIVASYLDLKALFNTLIKAYGFDETTKEVNDGNLQQFLAVKENIAVVLRPIWNMAAQKKERDRRLGLGIIGRLKEDILGSLESMYSYFSTLRIFTKK